MKIATLAFLFTLANAEIVPIALFHHQEPSLVLNSRFQTPGSIVNIAMNTDIPSLNLENVRGVRKLRCENSFVRVTIDNIDVAENWVVGESGLILQIGSQWKCDSSQTTVFRKVK